MNSARRFCLFSVVFFALAFLPASLARAQTSEADELIKRVIELYQAGKYAEAIPLAQRALAIREKALGPNDRKIATSVVWLGVLYYHQGRYAEAEPLYKRALAIAEKALGPDHPDVATELNLLAQLYFNQGRYADAEPFYRRSLAIREDADANSPAVAASLNNLALLYDKQGRYAEAEPLYKRALAITEKEKELGPEPPLFARLLNNLALLYYRQGRYAEAEPLCKRALAIAEKANGGDPADVAGPLNNLALLYGDWGRYAEAEPLYKRAVAFEEKAFGPDHPVFALALKNLALLYDKQGRYAEAEPLYKRALAIREKVVGPDNPDIATSLNLLAQLYSVQGRYAEALPLVRRTISNKTAQTRAALPALSGAQAAKLMPADETIDDGLNVVQRTSQTSAGEALNALAARFSAGNDRLAGLVRKDQDLKGEAAVLDKAIIAALSKEPSKRDAAVEQRMRDRITAIAKERSDLEVVLGREYPDYVALSNPQPLTTKDIQALLADDEVLVVINLGDKSYVWAITRTEADWKELQITAPAVSKQVSVLRKLLNFRNAKPFEAQTSYELYREILAPIEEQLSGKPRWNLVVNGALTSLPLQLLVTRDPTGKKLKDVDWLIRTHSVTVLAAL